MNILRFSVVTLALLLTGWGQETGGDQTGKVPPGKTVTLTVTADGTSPFRYQWYKDGAPIAGATGASLVLQTFATTAAGAYHAVIANDYGEVTSPKATLVVVYGPSRPAITIRVQ